MIGRLPLIDWPGFHKPRPIKQQTLSHIGWKEPDSSAMRTRAWPIQMWRWRVFESTHGSWPPWRTVCRGPGACVSLGRTKADARHFVRVDPVVHTTLCLLSCSTSVESPWLINPSGQILGQSISNYCIPRTESVRGYYAFIFVLLPAAAPTAATDKIDVNALPRSIIWIIESTWTLLGITLVYPPHP